MPGARLHGRILAMLAETANQMPMSRDWRWLVAALMLVVLSGCAAVEDQRDYHRHSMSDLREDWRQPGILLFEVTTSAAFPVDSETAEATRMEWLAVWMKRSGYCPAGWEILSRTAIDPMEVHARRHDLRYELKCAAAAPPAGD